MITLAKLYKDYYSQTAPAVLRPCNTVLYNNIPFDLMEKDLEPHLKSAQQLNTYLDELVNLMSDFKLEAKTKIITTLAYYLTQNKPALLPLLNQYQEFNALCNQTDEFLLPKPFLDLKFQKVRTMIPVSPNGLIDIIISYSRP